MEIKLFLSYNQKISPDGIKSRRINHVFGLKSLNMQEPESLENQLFGEMVHKAQGMDESSFATIYSQFVAPVFRFFYIRVKNKGLAEDLTQIVFLKAWKNIKSVSEIDNVLAWLYKVSRNVLIDYWRKKKDISVDNLSFLEEKGEKSDLTEEIDQNENLREIISVLDGLSDDQREIITLRFFEGVSSQEIQKIMKKSSTAVRSLQYRALENLRKILIRKDEKQ